jgi:hypothetical protein
VIGLPFVTAISVRWNRAGLAGLEPGPLQRKLVRALHRAGATALRDMRAEASKRIRARKRIKGSYIRRALTLRRARGADIAAMRWSLAVSGEPVPLVAYPHRQTRKGVAVEVNKGRRSIVPGAFKATMRSGHKGVYKRRGRERLPISELLGSRPVDALLHKGEAAAVAARGGASFAATLARLLPEELAKFRG